MKNRAGGHIPNYGTEKDFGNRWWNQKINTVDGIDGWGAQLDYLKEIVNLLKNRKSTFGFQVFGVIHYVKIGRYHDYMIKQLRR
jgi:hypothetical protein